LLLLKNGQQIGEKEAKKLLKTKQEIFEATKLVTETTWSKPLGLEVEQTVKPNQTTLALCLQFLSPLRYQKIFTKGRFYTENFCHQNIKT